MKNFKFIISLIVFCCVLFPESYSQQKNIKLKKAILYDSLLIINENITKCKFLGTTHKSPRAYLRIFNINKKTKPIYNYLYTTAHSPTYNFPIRWDINKKTTYSIAFTERRNQKAPSFSILCNPIDLTDTLKLKQLLRNEREEVKTNYPNEKDQFKYWENKAIKKLKLQNSRTIKPFRELLISNHLNYPKIDYNNKICFDFIANQDSLIDFAIRDDKKISLWRYNYPKSYLKPVSDENWKAFKTYYADTIQPNEKRIYMAEHIKEMKNLYYSIEDSSFFNSNFYMIKQNNNYFFISEAGNIYLADVSSLVKIGSVNLNTYDYSIEKEPYFIYDKNVNQILFFGEVNILSRKYPFIDYRIIKDDNEIKKYRNLKN